MSNSEHIRCSCCNAVSSLEIETNPGDYRKGRVFVPDPNNSLFFVCLDCESEVEEIASDWYFLEEDENGWDNHSDLFKED